MEQHSAEWYRGAVHVAKDCEEPIAVAYYTKQLAAAEAREAGEKHTASSVRGKKNADYWRGAVELLRQYKRGSIELTHVINQCLEAYEIEKAREAAQPSAAEVIRVAKAALEDCRGNVANHPDGHHKQFIKSEEMAEQALAAIAAWEAGDGKP